jgi:tight adherence protein C
MIRILAISALLGWAGLALLFAGIPALQQPTLAERLRPYTPGAPIAAPKVFAARSFREVIGPLATAVGSRIARVFGVHEELRDRLERVHSNEDPTAFRIRQAGWAVGALLATTALALAVHVPAPVAAVGIWIAPLLGFLVVEQQLAFRSERWQRTLTLELPVVSEQLAMLLTAGYSLGGALTRLSTRSSGAVAADFRRVLRRTRQGVSEGDALDEWAVLVRVPAVSRLASVLRLHGEAADLGRLVSDEARACRDEGHRTLLEAVERKTQQVWIPVTFAALVPGTIFLAVPFMSALRFFAQ